LQALGRTSSNTSASTDFSDADTLLNMSNFPDSVNALWAQNNNTPGQTRTLTVSGNSLSEVPVINSSGSGQFVTGILWDSSQDGGGGEYDTGDQEDLVFVSEIQYEQSGDHGTYDFEAEIPALLRSYGGSAGTQVVIYYELY
jgi:hypothetical protein